MVDIDAQTGCSQNFGHNPDKVLAWGWCCGQFVAPFDGRFIVTQDHGDSEAQVVPAHDSFCFVGILAQEFDDGGNLHGDNDELNAVDVNGSEA